MAAYRNVRLCDKECMCLYVCPTGATDTENSIIDLTKCISGCRLCVDACPSGAISLLPEKYPPPQPKTEAVVAAQRKLGYSKLIQEGIADDIVSTCGNPVIRQFAGAIAKSNRRMAEDILRESGYMLPQSTQVRELLSAIRENPDKDFPREAVDLLLNQLQ